MLQHQPDQHHLPIGLGRSGHDHDPAGLRVQYANVNNTAANTLGFLDVYFNNADGIATSPRHIQSITSSMAGGGWYNSVSDSSGLGEVVVPNNNFQTPALPALSAQADPAGAAWNFSGTAGIITNDTNIASNATSTTLGTLITPTGALDVGYKFTVGASNVVLYSLGRYVTTGNSGTHTLRLVGSTGTVTIASAVINTSGATAGTYVYASVGPILLSAGNTYYIVSDESSDQYYDQNTSRHSFRNHHQQCRNGQYFRSSWNLSQWVWTNGTTGNVAGPVDFQYAVTAVSAIGYPRTRSPAPSRRTSRGPAVLVRL